jgi:hypothetical protein
MIETNISGTFLGLNPTKSIATAKYRNISKIKKSHEIKCFLSPWYPKP